MQQYQRRVSTAHLQRVSRCGGADLSRATEVRALEMGRAAHLGCAADFVAAWQVSRMATKRICATALEAVADIPDGASILVQSFGPPQAWPTDLLLALRERGCRT